MAVLHWGTAVPVREEQSGIDHAGTGSVWNCPCSAVGTFNAEACIACERDESLAAGSVIMFMRSLGQFSSPLVLGFMARTAGASDIRFPYEGAALLSVVMMGVFWVNGLVRSSLKKQAAC